MKDFFAAEFGVHADAVQVVRKNGKSVVQISFEPQVESDLTFPLPLLGSQTMGSCRDCGQPVWYGEEYIVRPEIWEEAGLTGYFRSGFLHRTCLEKRLGRTLTPDDLFAWVVDSSPKKPVLMRATPEGIAFIRRAARSGPRVVCRNRCRKKATSRRKKRAKHA